MVTSFSDWEGTCLMHHGIKGQKWGVRRYQNEDGTLTTLGKLRGGREARKENRSLKRTLSDNKKYVKEWNKEKNRSFKRAVKDDEYRKNVAEMEARRLSLNAKDRDRLVEDFKQNTFAYDTSRFAANNIMWYKYGDRQYKDIVNKHKSREKIAKTILKKLEKRGLDINANGKHWQEELEKQMNVPASGKNAFDDKSAHRTLELLQAQREIERKRNKKR